jgi:hypothetical protein
MNHIFETFARLKIPLPPFNFKSILNKYLQSCHSEENSKLRECVCIGLGVIAEYGIITTEGPITISKDWILSS